MEMRAEWLNKLLDKSDLLIAVAVVTIVMMMIIPMNPILLDILITFNISFALIIVMVAMFNTDPLEFSVFPSLLLVMTLFRLALNISSTRLILLYAQAGEVIASFGSFVVGGNTVVGLVIFLILVIIQFVVITKGAERVSEVGARFTLDAMPGKQMAIDADLNAGLIDEQKARERRIKIQREADFYGAMDGASKFVKGDAIAGIIITIINIVGGLVIGVAQRGLPAGEAVQIYTLLTVGDGLVSQIPALLISTATGIVVTRSASNLSLGKEMSIQLTNYPKAMGIAAVILLVLGTIGLPRGPMYVLACILGLLYFALRSSANKDIEANENEELEEQIEEIKRPENVVELLQVEKMELELGYALIPLVDAEQGGDLLDRIVMIRRQCAVELGFIVPPVRIRDNMQLKPTSYSIKIKGIEIDSGELIVDNYLVIGPDIEKDTEITGVDTMEPAFKLPARWISPENRQLAELKGYTVVDPPSVLATHLTSIIKEHAHELIGRQEIQNTVDFIKEHNPAVVEELIPDLMNLGDIQRVLCNLLKEQISIRDMLTIMETLADYAKITRDPDLLSEYVRQSLKRQISRQYAEEGRLAVITMDPQLEETLRESVQQSEYGSYLAVDPDLAQRLMDKLGETFEKIRNQGNTPIIICAPVLRLYFKRFIDRFLSSFVVLSYNEIDTDVNVEVVGMVQV